MCLIARLLPQAEVPTCVCGLTMDVQTCRAGDDAGFILGGHGVPASVFLQGWLDDHTQVATVVLVHAGRKRLSVIPGGRQGVKNGHNS